MPAEAPTAPPPAAPAPAPDAPTAPPPEKAPADYLGNITGELTDMDAGKPPPVRDDKGKFKPGDRPAPAPKPGEKPPEKPAEAVKPPDQPGDKTAEVKPVKAAELRTAYDGLKKKVSTELEPELQRLRSKVSELETKAPGDTAPVLQKMKSLEERNTQLEQRIALVDYEQSAEYRTKYAEPYAHMWDRATNAFGQLTVKESDGLDEATGEPKFKLRRANEADLIDLGSKSLSELDEAAQRMFGASAPRAIQYIERLRDLAEAKQTAIAEAGKKSVEWKSQRTLEAQNNQKTLSTAWADINRGLEEKFPKAFQAEEGNAEDAASHTKGFALADLMFKGNKSLTPEQVEALPASFRDTVKSGKPLSEIQKVQLHALARLKMANHDRLIEGRKKDKARIAELEKTLSEYEKSEPKGGKGGEGGSAAGVSWEQEVENELRAMDRK